MGPNIPGGCPPGGQWPRDDGGGRRRRRKKKGGFLKFMGDLILCVVGTLLFCALVFAIPLFLGFDPVDAADFVDAPGLAKIDAFMDGWRHKHGISEMTFSHNGRSITFTDNNGTLSDIDAEGYDYDESGELESDLAEARRILKEWGLD